MEGTLDLYRGVGIYATVKINEDTEFDGAIGSKNKVVANFVTTAFLDVNLRDYCFIDGIKYQINAFVDFQIDHYYRYNVTFEASDYDLFAFLFLGSGGASFEMWGTVTDYANAIVARMNVVDSGWSVGDIEETGVLYNLNFAGDTCRSALTKICDKTRLEYSINTKTLNIVKTISNDVGAIILEYGKGKGLYRLSRKVEGEFFTRLYGEGSTRNIPAGYRSGKERLTFDPGYIDKGVDDWGVFEKAIQFDDIYPHRTGAITAVGGDYLTLSDSSIDFNLADNFITGQIPSIVMQSGDFTGTEFEIITTSYNHATKTFKIKQTYTGALAIPNAVAPINVGDQYSFIGINLPQSYVDDAEAELIDAVTNYLDANGSVITLSFSAELDEKFVRDNNYEGILKLGNKVNIRNLPSGIDADLRIVSLKYPILNKGKASMTIADKLPPDDVMEIQKIVISNATNIQVAENKIVKNKAYADLRLLEVQTLIFDPTGTYFDPINIKPLSIETVHIAVGTRSQTFALDVIFSPGATTFGWTAGKLDHYTIIPNTTITWNITGGTASGLVGATPYYIYAKCNKANSGAVIVVDTAKRLVDSDSTYYYFLVGILGSVSVGGVRWISLSYGTTEINGAFLRTGTILSQDGLTMLDLDSGIYRGRIEFLSTDEGSYKGINILDQEVADEITARVAITDTLKDMAFEDVVELAKLGTTIIIGGYIKTDLIDVDYIRANYIDTVYIEGLELNFTQGTIGGNVITSNGITGDKFSIIDGVLTAIDANISGEINAFSGTIGGNTIAVNGITGLKFSIIDGVLTAVDAYFENIEVQGLIADDATITNAIITNVTITDAEVTGEFKTGDTGQRALMTAAGISFYDASGGTAGISTDGAYTSPIVFAGSAIMHDGGLNWNGGQLAGANLDLGVSGNGASLGSGGVVIRNGGTNYSGETTSLTVNVPGGGTKTLNFMGGILYSIV